MLLLVAALVVSSLSGCANQAHIPEETEPGVEKAITTQLFLMADNAFADVIENYWTETPDGGYFHNRYKENRSSMNDLMWEYVMMLLAMETYYYATNDDSVLEYIRTQMDTYYKKVDQKWLLSVGEGNNPAHDDATCTAMGFMLAYRLLGDEKALDYCHTMIKKSYDYWQDGTTANGLWYCYPEDNNGHQQFKSIFCVGLILTELEYYKVTKGTDREDEELHERSLELYSWVEANLRRDGERTWNGQVFNYCDNLYFTDFADDKVTGVRYPNMYRNTSIIIPTQSWTSLYGNMAMSVINARLYRMTGDQVYLNKAISTANALTTTDFNNNGAFLNDRDAWANTTFLGFFIREVLPLDGVDHELGRMLMKTAVDIMKNTHYEGGFYGADWDGSGAWLRRDIAGEHTRWIATNATSVHVLFAAYAAARNGNIPVKSEDMHMFETTFPVKRLDEYGNVIE